MHEDSGRCSWGLTQNKQAERVMCCRAWRQSQCHAAHTGGPVAQAAGEPLRAGPRTPSSALRRRRPDANENDEPTPLRNPMRIPTPAR